MRTQLQMLGLVVVSLGLSGFVVGCSSTHKGKEVDVTADQMPAPARATMNREVGTGHVEKITREVEKGRPVYDVEANVGGKHMEYLIADSDGELLGTEVPIEYSQLPAPVKASAEKHFGTSAGLTAMKGVEYGKTHYEIEGMKDGKKSEISFDENGKKE
jgi:uncharacterized membrane protein YkoI